MRFGKTVLASVGAFVALAVSSPDASACGGCFPPPGEQNSVVTDHRMLLTVSKTQSTLYDQIQYSGNPKEFAWVLPIAGTVEVGLSADSLFTALHNLSAVVVQAPPTNCPPRPQCDEDEDGAAGGFAPTASDAGAGGVSVLKKEVVGPYETVQLKSDDPQALTNWLTQNGFNIPEDIKPVIAQYVAEKLNFLALRLKPGEGVSSMRPVRVTTQGAGAVLPLRMVAAGSGAQVGITLWVISEGRYAPQNFPSYVIKNEDLVWDWAASQSNYGELRAQRSAVDPGKTWEIESAQQTNRNQIENVVRVVGFQSGNGTGGDYLAIEDENGGVTKTADAVREEDLQTVFAGITQGQEHLTRMRADLSRAALATDLSLVASQDQGDVSNVRVPKGEKGQPLCPVYDGCRQVGVAPRDEAASRSYFNGGGTACQSGPHSSGGNAAFGAIGAFVALTFARVARRRRR